VRFVILLFLLFQTAAASVSAYDLPSSSGTHHIYFDADEGEFNEYTRIMDLKGHIKLQEYGEDGKIERLIRGNEFVVDMPSTTITAPSPFAIDDSSGTIYAERGIMNYGDDTGLLYGIRSDYDKFIFTGREAEVNGSSYIYKKGTFTSCNREPPHYHVSASSMKLVPKKYFLAYNMIFYLGTVPVFYFPVIYRPFAETPFSLTFYPGYDKRNGPFVKNNIGYKLNKETKITAYLDYFALKGFGLGGEFNFRRPEKNISNISVYQIKEYDSSDYRWGVNGGYWHAFNNFNESEDSAYYYSQYYFRLLSDPKFNNDYFRTNPFAVSDDKQFSVSLTRKTKYTVLRVSAEEKELRDEDNELFLKEKAYAPKLDFYTVPFRILNLPFLNSVQAYAGNGYETYSESYHKEASAEWTAFKQVPLGGGFSFNPSLYYEQSVYISTAAEENDVWTGRYGGKANFRYSRGPGTLDFGYEHLQRMAENKIFDDTRSDDYGQEKRSLYAELFVMPDADFYLKAGTAYSLQKYLGGHLSDRMEPVKAELYYSPSDRVDLTAQTVYDIRQSSGSFLLDAKAGSEDNYISFGAAHYTSDRDAVTLQNVLGFKLYPSASWRAAAVLRYRLSFDDKEDLFDFFEKSFTLYKTWHDFNTRLDLRQRTGGIFEVSVQVSLKLNSSKKNSLEEKSREYWHPWREENSPRDY